MLLHPQQIMHVMHSHSTNPSMFPMSPISPWGASTLTVPPNTPLSSTHPNAGHHHSPSVSPTEIIPHLYLSDLADAENPTLLASLGITHVFSAMPGFVNIPTHTTHTRIPKPILRAQIPIEDNPFAELAAHLPSSTAFIREALRDPEANVLVHCVQGISRSASVVCAFLMAFYGWPPTKAVTFVKTKRWIAEPNFGFVTQLHEYEKTLQQQQQQAHGHGQGHAR